MATHGYLPGDLRKWFHSTTPEVWSIRWVYSARGHEPNSAGRGGQRSILAGWIHTGYSFSTMMTGYSPYCWWLIPAWLNLIKRSINSPSSMIQSVMIFDARTRPSEAREPGRETAGETAGQWLTGGADIRCGRSAPHHHHHHHHLPLLVTAPLLYADICY